jgi:molybdenum cofactor guanylyltransferase
MGTDKAALEVGGEPLARRAADALREACGRVLVASGDGRRLAWLGLEQVADALAGAGPLAGIVAGLEAAPTPLVAVLAADMPHASPAVFRLLAARWSGQLAVVPRDGDGLQPLHAVYSREAATPLRAALEGGERSVRRALAGFDVLVLGPEEWADADATGRFARNVNRPEDLPESLP